MEMLIQIIGLLISIYATFFQKNGTNINFFINSDFYHQDNYNQSANSYRNDSNSIDDIDYKNRLYLSRRITNIFFLLFSIILLACFAKNWIENNEEVSTIKDILCLFYIPIFTTTRIILGIILSFGTLFVIKGWNKHLSIWNNIRLLKYFFIKLLFSIIYLISLLFANEFLITKIIINIENSIYSLIPFLICFIPFTELYWINFTMKRYFGLIRNQTYYQREQIIITYIITFLYPLLPTLALLYAMFF